MAHLMNLLAEQSCARRSWKQRPENVPHLIPRVWRERVGAGGGKSSDQPGPPLETGDQALPTDIPIVATEQLVAAVAGERYGDLSPSKLTHEECGNLRWICQRLVKHFCQSRNDGQCVGSCEQQLRVISTKMLGYRSRVTGLIELLVIKADGECFDRPIGQILHEGNNR